jgi:predicted Zn-dependent peptidase
MMSWKPTACAIWSSTDDEFERELKVVMEERRLRTDDKPQAQVLSS